MSHLFKIENKIVYPNTETLLIYPFKDIWERDSDENKVNAIRELTFIEFMTSMLKSNPYSGYDEATRKAKLIKDVIKDETWTPDELIIEGMKFILKLQTEGSLSYRYLMSNRRAAEKLISFFNNFNIAEKNPKTLNPIYKPKDITTAVADAERTITTLDALEKKVNEELYESKRTKADKVISPFAERGSFD